MNRTFLAPMIAAAVVLAAAPLLASPPEPVGISLLRIEMKKALLQQEAAPKLTEIRDQKLQAMRQGKYTSEQLADAELDAIQAHTNEALANLNVKVLDEQLKEALKSVNAPPAPPAAPPPAPKSNPPAPPEAEPPASPAEIDMLEFDLQKAKIQSDATEKIAANREKLFGNLKAEQAGGSSAGSKLADAEADAISARTSASLAAMEVEACQMRLDDAKKSVTPKK